MRIPTDFKCIRAAYPRPHFRLALELVERFSGYGLAQGERRFIDNLSWQPKLATSDDRARLHQIGRDLGHRLTADDCLSIDRRRICSEVLHEVWMVDDCLPDDIISFHGMSR